jgi:cyclophilin family peptidyl-prolyl cis-trans isomerase
MPCPDRGPAGEAPLPPRVEVTEPLTPRDVAVLVVAGFLVQDGDPLTRDRRNDGTGGGEERVVDERPAVSLVRGVVALANSGVRNSAGAQFFVLVSDARHLDATEERACAGGSGPLDSAAAGPVAQLVEHRTENAGVASSILAWATTNPGRQRRRVVRGQLQAAGALGPR